jgi:signal transduction histidine kinase
VSSPAAGRGAGHDRVTVALGRITAQATDLLEMISATLDAGEDRREPVHVPALLADVVADTRLTFSGSLSMSCRGPERATVVADRVMLRRALVNVLDNATRAAGPDGEVRVSVVGRPSTVDVVVEDDGPGFGRIPGGAGIGLDVVRRVAAECNGGVQFWTGRTGGVRVRLHLCRNTTIGGHEDRPL